MKKIFFTVSTILIFLAIVYLSLTPRPITIPVDNSDKYEHVLAYGVFALSMVFSLKYRGVRSWKVLIVLLVCAVVGGGIEIIQPHFGRTMDYRDFLADMAGAVLGSLAVKIGS